MCDTSSLPRMAEVRRETDWHENTGRTRAVDGGRFNTNERIIAAPPRAELSSSPTTVYPSKRDPPRVGCQLRTLRAAVVDVAAQGARNARELEDANARSRLQAHVNGNMLRVHVFALDIAPMRPSVVELVDFSQSRFWIDLPRDRVVDDNGSLRGLNAELQRGLHNTWPAHFIQGEDCRTTVFWSFVRAMLWHVNM